MSGKGRDERSTCALLSLRHPMNVMGGSIGEIRNKRKSGQVINPHHRLLIVSGQLNLSSVMWNFALLPLAILTAEDDFYI